MLRLSKRWVVASCISSAVAASALAQTSIRQHATSKVAGDGLWRTSGGKLTLLFDVDRLHELGLEIHTIERTALSDQLPTADATFAGNGGAGSGILFAARDGRFSALAGGGLPTEGEMLLVRADGETFRIGDFDVHVTLDARDSGGGTITDRRGTSREAFRFTGGMIQFDAASGRFEWSGADLSLDANWAHEIGAPDAGGQSIGTILVESPAVPAPNATPDPPAPPAGEDDGGSFGLVGPDVIVGDLQNVQRYGQVNGITAFSVGTTSCNIGTVWLNWISNTNQHPVIGQNMYRLKSGHFEQIGMSWLKNGFFALSEQLCFTDCQATNGSHLGVHCSDPYESSLNGDQGNLGPRWQVNAATGAFTYPPANPGTPATIGRRLQVHNTDLDPGQNAGALYFVEGRYVTPDDAAANNKNNNASYRRVNVIGAAGSGNYDIQITGSTFRQKAGIQAWKDNDPSVTLVDVDVPNDGRMTIGYKASSNGNGTTHFEYAVYNMNSDRSGQSFSIPIPPGANITNLGFHDVDYHSGDRNGNTSSGTVAFDGTDWTASLINNTLTWQTPSFATDPNSNALRWGTLYNFRFDADSGPQTGTATIGLYKPGTPTTATASVAVPGGPPIGPVSIHMGLRTSPTPNRGDPLIFDVTMQNTTPGFQDVQMWIRVRKPNGVLLNRNPYLGPFNYTIQGGGSQNVTFNRNIPNQITSGIWTLEGLVGTTFPNFFSIDSFTLTIP
jgi:hypothetical protein